MAYKSRQIPLYRHPHTALCSAKPFPGDDGLSLSEVLASATTPTLEQLRTHASAVSAMSLADKDSSEDYVKTADHVVSVPIMWMPFTHKMLPSKPSHKEGKQSETGLLKAKHTRPRHTRSRCTAQKKGRKGARRNHTAKKHTTANLALEVCHGLLQQQGAALSKLTDTAVSDIPEPLAARPMDPSKARRPDVSSDLPAMLKSSRASRRFSHATETQHHAAELSLDADIDMPRWPMNEYFCNSSPSTDWLGVLKLDKNSTGCTPSSQPITPSHQQLASADQFAAQKQSIRQKPFPHDFPSECSAPAWLYARQTSSSRWHDELPQADADAIDASARDPEGLPYLLALLENMRKSLVMMCTATGISTVLQMLKSLLDFSMSPRMLVESQIVTAVKLFKQHSDPTLSSAAKLCLQKWRRLLVSTGR